MFATTTTTATRTTTPTPTTSAASAPWRLPLPVPGPFLLTILVVCFTSGVASAQLHPSYNQRMTNAAQMLQQARERARTEPFQFWGAYPGSDLSGEEEEEEEGSVLSQLLKLDREILREAVLESVRSLSEEGFSRSRTNSRGETADLMIRESLGADQRCLNDTADILIALADKQQRKWALKVFDAMGKPSPAVSEGNFLWPGAYEMCKNIRTNYSLSSNKPNFSGRYCNAIAMLPMPATTLMGTGNSAALGLCAPDTCSSRDLTVLLNDVAVRVLNGTNITVTLWVDCDSPNPSSTLDARAIVAIVVCSLLLLLMVMGTLVDVIMQFGDRWFKPQAYVPVNGHATMDENIPLLSDAKPPTPTASKASAALKVLVAFSVYTNGSKLLSTSQPKGSLSCIHGIRFLSMTWVVLGHSYLFAVGSGENVAPFIQKSIDQWTFQAVANALVSVDSFFVISGLLVSYLTLNELKKKRGRINWFMFYFHRFWRLTPAYMLVIMVYVCLTPYWGEGPFFPSTSPDRDSCKESWWTNLLYLNNFVNMDKLCLGQSWYLANDMQFYCVLSPLVILPLFYSPLAGIIVASVLVLTHCVTNAALTVHNHYPPGMFVSVEGGSPASMAGWGPDFYMKPYTRWGPYVIGMVAGYFLHVTKCKLTIRWHVNAVLWGVATAAALAVLYGLYGVTTDGPISVSMSAFYNALHRNVWGLCLCWVIVACVTGNGGIVNSILSWSAFIPLSRLTYCIYLLHIMIMEIYAWNLRMPLYYTEMNIVFFFLAVLVISYMAAAVASLAFEAPMMALEKIMLAPFRSRDESRKHEEEQNVLHQNGGLQKQTS